MCGGFSVISKQKKLIQRFNAELTDVEFQPVYNARPGQDLPVILSSDLEKFKDVAINSKIQLAHFGYLPHWAAKKEGKALKVLPKQMINARAETIMQKPFFKDAFRHNRCLVLADSFFEWKVVEGGKQPYRILLKTEEPFAFAGIWDEIPDNEGTIKPSFAILTVEANREMRIIHERMPVILQPEDEQKWLRPNAKAEELFSLLKPYPEGCLQMYPVSKAVNNAANNVPEVIEKVNL